MRPDKTFIVLLGMAAAALAIAPTAAAAASAYGAKPNATSSKGRGFIKGEEGFSARAYPDGKTALGAQLYSIGYGHQITSGDGLTKNSIVTPEQASIIFDADLLSRERAVRDAVRPPLNQNQFDALVSLAYNIGISAFKSSTLVKRLNAGDFKGALAEFAVWNKSGGKVNAVLVARRKREADLFAS